MKKCKNNECFMSEYCATFCPTSGELMFRPNGCMSFKLDDMSIDNLKLYVHNILDHAYEKLTRKKTKEMNSKLNQFRSKYNVLSLVKAIEKRPDLKLEIYNMIYYLYDLTLFNGLNFNPIKTDEELIEDKEYNAEIINKLKNITNESV